MCDKIYGHFSRTRMLPIARPSFDLIHEEKTIMQFSLFFPTFAYQNTRDENRSLSGSRRFSVAEITNRFVRLGSRPGDSCVSDGKTTATARRKGNGVTCESSGSRNVFAKTGGSCGGGPDVFTTRIRLYKTVLVFLYCAFPSTSPFFPLPLAPLLILAPRTSDSGLTLIQCARRKLRIAR